MYSNYTTILCYNNNETNRKLHVHSITVMRPAGHSNFTVNLSPLWQTRRSPSSDNHDNTYSCALFLFLNIFLQWSFVVSFLFVALFMFCNYDNHKMWKKFKTACRRAKVEPVRSDSSEEIELNVHYQDGFYQRPAGKI